MGLGGWLAGAVLGIALYLAQPIVALRKWWRGY